jgi:hypothetical protein
MPRAGLGSVGAGNLNDTLGYFTLSLLTASDSPSGVPEIDPRSGASVLALLITALGLAERRRRLQA